LGAVSAGRRRGGGLGDGGDSGQQQAQGVQVRCGADDVQGGGWLLALLPKKQTSPP